MSPSTSFPSGHASSSAAGLIYLTLFLASKFAVTIPFFAPTGYSADYSAFPSRLAAHQAKVSAYEPVRVQHQAGGIKAGGPGDDITPDPTASQRVAAHHRSVVAVRRQAAAPPLYLLTLVLLPFFASVFIASSRWFDFRHHGFDILFGFLIGTLCAWFSFRYYHLPISQGAGWGWGPRSADKAFWAGVGSYSYATGKDHPPGEADVELQVTDVETSHVPSMGESSGIDDRRNSH